MDGVSLEVPAGKTLGIVGESGCGKSTLAKTIVGLESPTAGKAEFLGFDITVPVSARDVKLIQELQMVFQNPDSTMNPSYSVGQQIGRPLQRFKTVPANQVREEVIRLLHAVRLDGSYYDRLPRQLSGGEKQRVGIARAFASRPELVLCDEPVSALDVSVQAAVLNLLLEIQHEYQHDHAVHRPRSERGALFLRLCGGDVPGSCGRIRTGRSHLCSTVSPLYRSAAFRRPDPRSNGGAEAHPAGGHRAQRAEPAQRLCFPYTLPPACVAAPMVGLFARSEVPPWRYNTEQHRIFCHIPLEVSRQMEPVVTAG